MSQILHIAILMYFIRYRANEIVFIFCLISTAILIKEKACDNIRTFGGMCINILTSHSGCCPIFDVVGLGSLLGNLC